MLVYEMKLTLKTKGSRYEKNTEELFKFLKGNIREEAQKDELLFAYPFSCHTVDENKEPESEYDKVVTLFLGFEINRIMLGDFVTGLCERLDKILGKEATDGEICETTIFDILDQLTQVKRPDRKFIEYLKGFCPSRTFSVYPEVVSKVKMSMNEALKEADAFMADESVTDEIRRIYARKNKKQYIGHPVHYKISAMSITEAKRIYKLIVKCLYNNNRIVSSRVDVLSGFTPGMTEDVQLGNCINNTFGSTLLIDPCMRNGIMMHSNPQTNQQDDCFDFAEFGTDVSKKLAEIIEDYSEDMLVIVFDNQSSENCSKAVMEELSKELVFVELKEGRKSQKEAKDFVGSMITGSDLAKFAKDVELNVPYKDDGYTSNELCNIYRGWRSEVIRKCIYKSYSDIENHVCDIRPEEDAYEELMGLEGGLCDAKRLIEEIVATHRINSLRAKKGLSHKQTTLHMVFSGNPGTGKTTAARLIAKILSQRGVIKKDIMVECGRADLVGEFVGHTAKRVRSQFAKAEGGVLFIDEAYSLVSRDDFGKEAINTIVQEMENHRDTVVIFAGYPKAMDTFLKANEGLRSRVAYYLNFPDYSCQEMINILQQMVTKENYELNEAALLKCTNILKKASNTENFGNARYVRNLCEKAILAQAMRLNKLEKEDFTEEELKTLRPEDFSEIEAPVVQHTRAMGFQL